MPRLDRPVILLDGGLPGLVACALAIEASPPATPAKAGLPPALVLQHPAAGSAHRARAVQHQAETLALERLAWERPLAPDSPINRVLLEAASIAAAAGSGRLIWPAHAQEPSNLDAAAARVDRALLISRLVAIDAPEHGRPDFKVETPLADLGDIQVAELALDLDVPISACAWWEPDAEPDERVRWLAALAAAGWIGEGEAITPRGSGHA